MIAMIILGIVSILVIVGIITFTVNIIVPLAGILLGLLAGIILLISAWLSAFAVVTVAGLQKNENGFFECKRWWKKWNKWMGDIDNKVAKIPKDSCQFYWYTVGHMGWSPVFCIFAPIAIIIAVAINLAIGRVPKLRSLIALTANEGLPDKPFRFTEEHCRLSPMTIYGVVGIYFLFRYIGYGVENLSPVMPAITWIWMIGIATSIGILILAIVWKSEPIKKFIRDCCEIATDLKDSVTKKFCIPIVK